MKPQNNPLLDCILECIRTYMTVLNNMTAENVKAFEHAKAKYSETVKAVNKRERDIYINGILATQEDLQTFEQWLKAGKINATAKATCHGIYFETL